MSTVVIASVIAFAVIKIIINEIKKRKNGGCSDCCGCALRDTCKGHGSKP